MKSVRVRRASLVVVLLLSPAVGRVLEFGVDSLIGDGDGQVALLGTHAIVSSLPNLVWPVALSLLIYWFRGFLRKDELVGACCIALAGFGLLEFTAKALGTSGRAFTREYGEYGLSAIRRNHPYLVFKGDPDSDRTNELGNRGPAPTPKKAPGEYRIFFLGGSATWNGDPTIPELVERAFARDGLPNVRVFNFGAVASVSPMAVNRIVFEISSLEPDLILMYNGANDITHALEFDPRPGYPMNFMLYEVHPLSMRPYPVWPLLFFGSHTVRTLAGPYFEERFTGRALLRDEAGWGTDAWRRGIASSYVESLERGHAISEAFGSAFVAFFQPMLFFKDTLSEEEEEYLQRYSNLFPDPEMPANHHMLVRDLIRAEVSGVVDFEDLSDLYDGTAETVFTDVVHTYQRAKLLVASAIYEGLRQRIDDGVLVPQAGGRLPND